MIIKKNDNVLVIKGKDRGKTGKVEKTYPQENRVMVLGVNINKKHSRPSQKSPHGGIINISSPIKANNLMIICPRCSKASRINFKITKEKKLRICQKCHETVDNK